MAERALSNLFILLPFVSYDLEGGEEKKLVGPISPTAHFLEKTERGGFFPIFLRQ